MASLADRVRETTASTGTGTITLAGASAGFQTFTAAFSTGTVVEYALVSGNNWETGRGTFTAAGTLLSRDEVYSSSSAGAKITLAGTSDVFITPSAQSFAGKQSYHGFNLSTAAPSEITNGLRRVSLDNAANVDLSYDSTTRQITLTQTGGIIYWYKGQKVTVASPLVSTAHSATAGAYYFSFDDATGTLNVSGTAWSLTEKVPVSEVYYDGTKGVAWDERHSAQRDPAVHSYLHNTQGAKWSSGGVVSGYTLEGSTNASMQYAMTAATLYDEDIRVATPTVVAAGPYTCWYKSGGVWTFDTTPTVPYKFGTNIQYNNAGTLTDLVPGEFVNIYEYGATNLLTAHRLIHHIGQAKYGNLGDALEEGLTALDLTGFPSPETTPMYRRTYYCDGSLTTSGKATLVDIQRIGGDRNFNPSTPSNRSPDHMTMGRTVAIAKSQQFGY